MDISVPIKLYHVALDCDIDKFINIKQVTSSNHQTFGNLSSTINNTTIPPDTHRTLRALRMPVVFSFEEAQQLGNKIIKHMLRRGPTKDVFPITGYLIVELLYYGQEKEPVLFDKNIMSYRDLLESYSHKDLIMYKINNSVRGIIKKTAFESGIVAMNDINLYEHPVLTKISNYYINFGLQSKQKIENSILSVKQTLNKQLDPEHTLDKQIAGSRTTMKIDSDIDNEYDKLYEQKYLKYKQKYNELRND